MNDGFQSEQGAENSRVLRNFSLALKWEILLIARYQIITMSVFIAATYAAIFYSLDLHYDDLIILTVFSDPVMMGFMFTGVLVLYDKNQNVLQAQLITPMNPAIKLAARGIALTLLALLCSFGIAIAGKGLNFHYGMFTMAVVLSSILFYYIGIISLIGVSSFNGFLMKAVLYMMPFMIPMVELADIYTNPIFYLFPTKAILVLFKASFTEVTVFNLTYAFLYLLILIPLIQFYAVKKYQKGDV